MTFLQFTLDQAEGLAVADGWATVLASYPDPHNPQHRHAVTAVRYVSAIGPDGVIRGLARLIRRATPKSASMLCWTDGVTHQRLGSGTLCDPFTVRVTPLEKGVCQLVAWPTAVQEGRQVLDPDQNWPAAVRAAVLRGTDLPVLPEWAPALSQDLAPYLTPWPAHGRAPAGADLTATPAEIATRLQEGLAQGRYAIPAGPAARDLPIGDIGHLDTYLKSFGPALGRPLAHQARHQPGTAPAYPLLRTLYPAQADTAEALVQTWAAGERTVWAVGEAGVGKTIIGLAAAWRMLDGRPGRILVHAPGHLTAKWAREAGTTLPQVTVHTVRSWRDAWNALRPLRTPPVGVEVWILPRDTAKLGWQWRPAAVPTGRAADPWACPDCGAVLARTFADKNRKPVPFPADAFRSRGVQNARCPECGASLWQADPTGPRRIAPATLWAKRLPAGTFDVLLADEAHEEKGDTAQGAALGRLLRLARHTALLTGTLLGGKASDLAHLVARTQPTRFRARGFDPGTSAAPFVATYGRVERRAFERQGRPASRTRELPGVHPALYGDWLLGRAVFLELQDLQLGLPSYEETVTVVPMAPAQQARVEPVMQALRGAAGAAFHAGRRGALGTYVQAALAYPDRVWQVETPRVDGRAVPVRAPGWDPDKLLPKEAALVSTALREHAQGRRCLVYCTFTGVYDVAQRLAQLLTDQGLTVAHLTTAVPPADREAWIEAHPADVLLCHPRLISTGLDAVEYPTILWAQTDWSLYLLRQASRRSWRIGQTEPVRVHFFAYADTMQATALQVLADKMLAAQAIEGRFSAEGLQMLADGTDTALRLAEALAYGLEALPDLASVWPATPAAKSPPTKPVGEPGAGEPAMPPGSRTPFAAARTVVWRDLRHASRRQHPDQLVLLDLVTSA